MREDWIECDLQEVCLSSKGKKPPILENKISEKINVPYINIKAFEKGIIDEYTDGNKCNLCEDGDLLMVWDGARAGLSGKAKKGAVGSTLMKIEEVKGIEKQYLSYFLLSLYTKINTNPRGVGIPHVEPRILWYSKLLLVSSPIQRAIVSKIEALFSDLDNGIANFKTAQAQLKIYRQAVLKKAFEGELTKEWRVKTQCIASLPTAEQLLKQIKEERQNHYNQQLEDWKKAVKDWEKNGKKEKKPSKPTAPKELPPLKKEELEELPILPDGWVWVKLGNCMAKLSDGPFGSHLKTEDYIEKGIRVVRLENIKNLFFDDSKKSFVSLEKYNSIINHTVYSGDIIFSTFIADETKVAIVPSNIEFAINKADCICIRPHQNVYNKYLEFFLSTRHSYNQLVNQIHGATRPRVNTTQIKSVPFLLCSLPEQTQIVQEIESRLSVCDKVEQSISESLVKAEALRQSILKKAFEGKLLSDAEIEQCKKEADYEPAAKLLERIKQEKLKKENKQKSKIKKP